MISLSRIAILRMDDVIEEGRANGAPFLVLSAMRASRSLLAGIHGEPTKAEREEWNAMTADAKAYASDPKRAVEKKR